MNVLLIGRGLGWRFFLVAALPELLRRACLHSALQVSVLLWTGWYLTLQMEHVLRVSLLGFAVVALVICVCSDKDS
jgi:hypothetical protein